MPSASGRRAKSDPSHERQRKPALSASLTVETLAARLASVPELRRRIDADPAQWRVREVGDGNLNLVFIVEGRDGGVVVKQALPYVRLVGESWPLPLKRSFFEYHALKRQSARDPGRVPQIFHFDEAQALIAMEYLTPHVILREASKREEFIRNSADSSAASSRAPCFAAPIFRCRPRERKADLALFADNVAFATSPRCWSSPIPIARAAQPLDQPATRPARRAIARRRDLKVAAQHLKMKFCAQAETLLHGDLHTGSIMVHEDDARAIDPGIRRLSGRSASMSGC